jgi:hypothetical protein
MKFNLVQPVRQLSEATGLDDRRTGGLFPE